MKKGIIAIAILVGLAGCGEPLAEDEFVRFDGEVVHLDEIKEVMLPQCK
jgi:hypothetical protein